LELHVIPIGQTIEQLAQTPAAFSWEVSTQKPWQHEPIAPPSKAQLYAPPSQNSAMQP
jgi:hypothetical protein